MSINHDSSMGLVYKKNEKIVDAVNYNGRYVDANDLRKKIMSVSALLAAILSIVVLFFL